MKIRMITFHTPKNYGAVLQAFALYAYYCTLSDDVKVIDYHTQHLDSLYPLISPPSSIKGFVKFCFNLLHLGKKKSAYRKFEKFLQENMQLTQKFSSFEDLCGYAWENDTVFSTGSDQVFNPRRIDDERQAFYLDFVPDYCKKISYAASVGDIKVIPSEKAITIKDSLKSFFAISIREKSGVQTINSLIGEKAVEVIDPTLLHGENFYRNYEKAYPNISQNYVLYYRLLEDYNSDEYAYDLAKKMGKKLLVITNDFYIGKGKVLRNVGPAEFLYLYRNADYVVTSSFHGIAFSLIYNKQFYFCDNNIQTNGRGLQLLEKLNINNGEEIDYTSVNKKLDFLREESEKFIKSGIEMV